MRGKRGWWMWCCHIRTRGSSRSHRARHLCHARHARHCGSFHRGNAAVRRIRLSGPGAAFWPKPCRGPPACGSRARARLRVLPIQARAAGHVPVRAVGHVPAPSCTARQTHTWAVDGQDCEREKERRRPRRQRALCSSPLNGPISARVSVHDRAIGFEHAPLPSPLQVKTMQHNAKMQSTALGPVLHKRNQHTIWHAREFYFGHAQRAQRVRLHCNKCGGAHSAKRVAAGQAGTVMLGCAASGTSARDERQAAA